MHNYVLYFLVWITDRWPCQLKTVRSGQMFTTTTMGPTHNAGKLALPSLYVFILQDAFRTLPLSVLRVLVMMIGELDFAAFVELYKNQDPYSPFRSAAYTFLFLCLFLLSVGLMNLLVRTHAVHIIIYKSIK